MGIIGFPTAFQHDTTKIHYGAKPFLKANSNNFMILQDTFEIYTANVLSAEFTDECLQIKSKDN